MPGTSQISKQMNSGENLLNTITNIFGKIIEQESAQPNRQMESKQTGKPPTNYLTELDERNRNTYDRLIELYETIKISNSPNNETIRYHEEFIKHIEELLEAKSFSELQPDVNFCNAIFSLKNIAIEEKLRIKMLTGFNIGEQEQEKTVDQESNGKVGHREYNKPTFTTYQILFLMNELRRLKFTISDLNNTKMAQGIHILTGYSVNTLRPDLGKIISGEIMLSEKDKNQLREILDQLGKAVDKI